MLVDASASSEIRPVRAGCAVPLAAALGTDPKRAFLLDVSTPAGIMAALVSHEAPFVWAAGDQINLSGLYQRA